MSDAVAPVIFKRSKAKAGQRARPPSPQGEDANGGAGDGEVTPSTLATKLKKSRVKPQSRLSFGSNDHGAEGEGELFKVKKSNLSHKLALGKSSGSPLSLPGSLDQATISSSTPVYDAAYLSQLKANTPGSRPRVSQDASGDVEMSFAGDDALVQTTDGMDDSETAIPSESSISAAKEKRDRLRKAPPTGEDYISLSVSKYDDGPKGPHPDSRLVREEDEIGEGEDEYAEYTSAQDRVALGKKSRKREASKRKEEMKEMIADAEEEDEETAEWEQEQLRRGGHAADDASQAPAQPVYKPAPIPEMTSIPTMSSAITRLTHSLTTLTTSHAENSSTMASLAEERAQLDAREAEMRGMITKAEEKRSWFAAFREWVENVATFLDEKFPLLERLEDEHISLLRERHDLVTKRRRADDEDDLTLLLGPLPMEAQPEEELDELGRVVQQANPAAARSDRRRSRTSRHARHHAKAQQEEGYSTDSSLLAADAEDFQKAIQKLEEKVQDVLSDVRASDFKDPRKGLARWFGDWRATYDDIYVGAWGGLGLVGAWEFYVRLEIIGWDPISDPRSLDSFRWYTALYQYSRQRPTDSLADEDLDTELGPDGDLVSAMISTAVVPRICKLIEGGAFDPYSMKDVRHVIDMAEQMEVSTERDNAKFQMLLKAVVDSFRGAVVAADALLSPYMALSNPRFDPEAVPARLRFMNRLHKLLQGMLRWRKYAGERYGIGELVARLICSCMLPVAETGWEVGGEEKLRKIASSLPLELVPNDLKARLGGVGVI